MVTTDMDNEIIVSTVNETAVSIQEDTLSQAEQEFEEHIVKGTNHIHRAWLTLDAIRKSEVWRDKILSVGGRPDNFDVYLRDLLECLRDKYSNVHSFSQANAWFFLRWIRRAEGIELPVERVLSIPPTALNMLSQMARWDSKTGEIKRVNNRVTNIDALPGQGTPEERFKILLEDVAHSPYPIDDVRSVRMDFSDEFTYRLTTFNDRVTAMRVQWVRTVNEVAQSAKWYDVFVDTLPEEVLADLALRLDAFVKLGEFAE